MLPPTWADKSIALLQWSRLFESISRSSEARFRTKGSLGGGIMEHKFVEMSKDKLRRNEREVSLKQQFHDKVAAKNQSGMICSGEQKIFLYSIKKSDVHHVNNIISCLEQNNNGLLTLSPAGLSFSDYKIPSKERVSNTRFNETDLKSAVGYSDGKFSTVLRYNFNNLDTGLPEEGIAITTLVKLFKGRVFKEQTWDALQSLKEIFHYHFINAQGTIEEVEQNIIKELEYQSTLELDPRTRGKISGQQSHMHIVTDGECIEQ